MPSRRPAALRPRLLAALAPLALAGACRDATLPDPPARPAVAGGGGAARPDLVPRPEVASPGIDALGHDMAGPPAGPVASAAAAGEPGLLWHLVGTGSFGAWTWRNGAPGALAGDWRGYGISAGWNVVAVADFNGDGVGDWVVRQGSTTTFGVYVAPPASGWAAFGASPGWEVIDAADFDGDGAPDLLWRGPADATAGLGGIWLMTGLSPKPAAAGWRSLNVSPGWHPDAAADFDGDAKPDVVWHQTGTGNFGLWQMAGTTRGALPAAWHPFSVSPGWEVFDAADLDGNATPELLFRDGAGNAGLWKTSGWGLVSIAGGGWVAVAGSPGWRVVGATTGAAAAPSAPNLAIDRVTLTQAVQRFDNSIPLVIGGNGVLVNVYATASRALPAGARPPVRVRVLRAGVLVAEDTRPLTGPLDVAVDPTYPSHQVYFPPNVVGAGGSVVAEIDPANTQGEAVRADNVYPRGGTPLPLQRRLVPPLVVRFVPLAFPGGRGATVTAGNAAEYLVAAREMWPLGAVTAEVATPLTVAAGGNVASPDWWIAALAELEARRVAESAGTTHYYGVLFPAADTASPVYGGMGYQPWSYGGSSRSAIGLDVAWPSGRRAAAETFAHEIGHNFGRSHAPCGGAGGTDPTYPYADGSIGVVGYNVHALTTGSTTQILPQPASAKDLMGYCGGKWVSDYHYLKVLEFRGATPVDADEQAADRMADAPTEVLLVSGVVGARGATLNPVYAVRARPHLPARAGAWRLEGLDASGATLFAYPFAPPPVDHGPAGPFAFALPLDAASQQRLAVVRVVGPAGAAARGRLGAADVAPGAAEPPRARRLDGARVEVAWPAARWPGALVRDPVTGEVLAFGAGGAAIVRTPRAELLLVLSDGVHSESRRVAVTP